MHKDEDGAETESTANNCPNMRQSQGCEPIVDNIMNDSTLCLQTDM